jgi:hypothetical protein
MIKMFSTMAVTGLMALAMSGVSQAQERTFKKMTAGQPAALNGAMTQAQARKACRVELAGTRESKRSLNTKMKTCMNLKMNGN